MAGLLSALLPADFFTRHLDNEPLSLLLMLASGIPLYICASASTPIAAALVLKGLSPGAALVFLLAGPATNAATIIVVRRFWGGAATAVYLASIASCSLLLGWLANRVYALSGLEFARVMTGGPLPGQRPLEQAAAAVLLLLLLRSWWPGRRQA